MVATEDSLVDDLRVIIASFLDVQSLGRLACVSKAWNVCSKNDAIWEARCEQSWVDKPCYSENTSDQKTNPNKPVKLFKMARFDPATMLTLTVRELKHLTSARNLSTKGCLTKGDFRDLLTKYDKTIAPLSHRPESGKWRASYLHSQADMHRRNITLDELCSIEWYFIFLEHMQNYSSVATFNRDFRFHMDPWPMQDPGPEGMGYYFNPDNTGVGIAHFPIHEFHRLPTSANWCMTNRYVAFFQKTDKLDQDVIEFVNVFASQWR